MFAQCFQYMIDVTPLYLLSKAWPILMAPLACWAVMRLEIPYKPLYIITLVWLLGITPMIGIIQLGNAFTAAMATTAKVWGFSFVFSAAAALALLRPSPATLRRTVLGLGTGTYLSMMLLWVVVPPSHYGGGDAVTKLFMFDPERGRHIYMPMFFGVLMAFYLNRSFWIAPRLWKLLALALAFVLMLTIYKERTTIAAVAMTVVVAIGLRAGRARMAVFAVLAVTGFISLTLGLLYIYNSPGLNSLGGSLSVRSVSIATAWRYLSADPLRWLFGIGATTRFGNVTLAQMFGNSMFFLTDIGWLGVMFEYGVVGVVLILLVYLAGLRLTALRPRRDDPLSEALFDYIVFLLIESTVYSVVFTPGELTTVMALAFYLRRYGAISGPPYGGGVSQPLRPMPRQSAVPSARPSGLVASVPSGIARSG